MTDPVEIDVLIHAGFHKTGTSSLQSFLAENRDALSPHFLFYGKSDFLAAGSRARRYGQRPFPWRLWAFRKSFRAFLNTVPDGHRIVLSRETFSGVMPGHRCLFGTISAYPHAPILARTIVTELTRRFGPDIRIAFAYSTRERESWLRSLYGHLLRSIRVTDNFKAFKIGINADLPAEIATIQHHLGAIPVYTLPLKTHANAPAGPATAILDLMGVPGETQTTLKPATRRNIGDPLYISQEFLALNRSVRRKPDLVAQKSALLARERNGHDETP